MVISLSPSLGYIRVQYFIAVSAGSTNRTGAQLSQWEFGKVTSAIRSAEIFALGSAPVAPSFTELSCTLLLKSQVTVIPCVCFPLHPRARRWCVSYINICFYFHFRNFLASCACHPASLLHPNPEPGLLRRIVLFIPP